MSGAAMVLVAMTHEQLIDHVTTHLSIEVPQNAPVGSGTTNHA